MTHERTPSTRLNLYGNGLRLVGDSHLEPKKVSVNVDFERRKMCVRWR